jgi:ABC-type uncharacterized transport system substrate-binding protein
MLHSQKKLLPLLLSALLVYLAQSPSAQAHPHVWIGYSFKITSTREGMNRLDFTWRPDEMFSSLVQEDLSAHNLTFNDGYILKDHAFADLTNNKYFLDIRFDNQILNAHGNRLKSRMLNPKNKRGF